jgi:hypothetical protein
MELHDAHYGRWVACFRHSPQLPVHSPSKCPAFGDLGTPFLWRRCAGIRGCGGSAVHGGCHSSRAAFNNTVIPSSWFPRVAPEARFVLSGLCGIWYSPLSEPIRRPLYASAVLLSALGIWRPAIYTKLWPIKIAGDTNLGAVAFARCTIFW